MKAIGSHIRHNAMISSQLGSNTEVGHLRRDIKVYESLFGGSDGRDRGNPPRMNSCCFGKGAGLGPGAFQSLRPGIMENRASVRGVERNMQSVVGATTLSFGELLKEDR